MALTLLTPSSPNRPILEIHGILRAHTAHFPQVYLGDRISDGLDSASTLDLVRSLRIWCRAMDTTIVVAMLQPPPEILRYFDKVVMLDDQEVKYYGPPRRGVDVLQRYGVETPMAWSDPTRIGTRANPLTARRTRRESVRSRDSRDGVPTASREVDRDPGTAHRDAGPLSAATPYGYGDGFTRRLSGAAYGNGFGDMYANGYTNGPGRMPLPYIPNPDIQHSALVGIASHPSACLPVRFPLRCACRRMRARVGVCGSMCMFLCACFCVYLCTWHLQRTGNGFRAPRMPL